jgi:hypothetical protein
VRRSQIAGRTPELFAEDQPELTLLPADDPSAWPEALQPKAQPASV